MRPSILQLFSKKSTSNKSWRHERGIVASRLPLGFQFLLYLESPVRRFLLLLLLALGLDGAEVCLFRNNVEALSPQVSCQQFLWTMQAHTVCSSRSSQLSPELRPLESVCLVCLMVYLLIKTGELGPGTIATTSSILSIHLSWLFLFLPLSPKVSYFLLPPKHCPFQTILRIA